MIYLATASTQPVRDVLAEGGAVGQLLSPSAGHRLVPGARFAIDNGVVRIIDGQPVTDPAWTPDRWLGLLDRHRDDGALFTAVPDAVGDVAETNRRWARWHGAARNRGYRCAYVLQDGCRTIPASAGAVFIGGSTAWKLGPQARTLVATAKRHGLWVHMGRVNSLRRLRYAADLGCDSADGTYLAFGPDVNLPRLLSWLDPDAPGLFGGVA